MFVVIPGATHTVRRGLIRVSVVVLLAAAALLLGASPALALKIAEAKNTGPVAYELKSLQTTHFYCTVDTPGTWATLRIRDGEGRVVRTIYSGPIKDANKRFWFPAWNGLDDAGNRLFSASWNWELTVNKGNAKATRTGKITVSKIQFFIKGKVGNLSDDYYSRYMIPGNANIYIRTSSTAYYDLMTLEIEDPRNSYWSGMFDVDKYAVRNITTYLRGRDAIDMRGLHDFYVGGANDISYYITVIQ